MYTNGQESKIKRHIFKKIEFQIKCTEKTFSNILQKSVEVLKSIKTKKKKKQTNIPIFLFKNLWGKKNCSRLHGIDSPFSNMNIKKKN